MDLTAKERELMEMIGDGEYGWCLPEDDAAVAALTSLHERGLIGSEAARIDDFLFVTPAGRKAISAAA